jgi:hypothetical protein
LKARSSRATVEGEQRGRKPIAAASRDKLVIKPGIARDGQAKIGAGRDLFEKAGHRPHPEAPCGLDVPAEAGFIARRVEIAAGLQVAK